MKIRKISRRVGDKEAALVICKNGRTAVIKPKNIGDAGDAWPENMVTICDLMMLMEDPTRKHEMQLVASEGYKSYERYRLLKRFFDPIYMGNMGIDMLKDAVDEFKALFSAFTAHVSASASANDGEKITEALRVIKTINVLLVNMIDSKLLTQIYEGRRQTNDNP